MTNTHAVRCHFLVCTNTRPAGSPLPSCGQRGSGEVYAAFQRELALRGLPPGVKVTATVCLTPCQHGPTVVVYPQGAWYGGTAPSDVPEIMASHLDDNAPVERLLLPPDARLW